LSAPISISLEAAKVIISEVFIVFSYLMSKSIAPKATYCVLPKSKLGVPTKLAPVTNSLSSFSFQAILTGYRIDDVYFYALTLQASIGFDVLLFS
jgi:hypothetical protein